MQYIGIFNGNPTAGSTDGSEVSQSGVASNPISADLAAGASEVITCAVRCESGYAVSGNVTLSNYDTDVQLSSSPSGTFGNSLTLSGVTDVNTLFYVKLTAGSNIGVVSRSLALQANIVTAS